MGDEGGFAAWLHSGFKWWLWQRVTHSRRCGGRWDAEGGCPECAILRRYPLLTAGVRL